MSTHHPTSRAGPGRRALPRRSLAVLLLAGLFGAVPAAALDLFVDQANGDDAASGLSWATAKATVTAALEVAASEPGPHVVHVAAGHYIEELVVPSQTALLGGYPPGGGARDPARHRPVIDGAGDPDGSFTVLPVRFQYGSDGASINGFTVQGGHNYGGISIRNASALVRDVVVQHNTFGCPAGGINIHVSEPNHVVRIEDSVVRDNSGGCVFGTPWYSEVSVRTEGDIMTPPVIARTLVSGRQQSGAAVSLVGSVRIEHSAIVDRGGLLIEPFFTGSVELFDVEVSGHGGAGIAVSGQEGTAHRFENVTITGNGGPGIEVTRCANDFTVEVVHSILWGNNTEIALGSCPPDRLDVRDSLVRGGWPGGTGVIDADPLFVPGPLSRHYLAHADAGQPVTSPAIDAGSISAAAAGLDGRTTRTDGVPDTGPVDLGAHHAALAALTILRGTEPDDLQVYRLVPGLPFTDDPGTLSDPDLPLLFYRVAEATTPIEVAKDVGNDAPRLTFRAATP